MSRVLFSSVTVDGRAARMVYEYGPTYYNLYIEDIMQLININSGTVEGVFDGASVYRDVLDDIANHRIEVVKYAFLGVTRYDFRVLRGGSWNDYPRPNSILLSTLRTLGKETSCGYLELWGKRLTLKE